MQKKRFPRPYWFAVAIIIIIGALSFGLLNILKSDLKAESLQEQINSDADDLCYSCDVGSGCQDLDPRTSTHMCLGETPAAWYESCFRFNDISLANGDTIIEAYVQFKAATTESASGTIVVSAKDEDNAANCNLDGAWSATGNTNSYIPASWVTDNLYNSSNFDPVVQEVIDRDTWSSGGSLAIVFDGEDQGAVSQVQAYSHNDSPSSSAVLNVSYTPGNGGVPEFNTLTLILTIGAAGLIIVITHKYILKPRKVSVRK